MDNIRWATKDMKISYPVAVDSEHLIWRGFRNQYWPALYFIDTQGGVELEDSIPMARKPSCDRAPVRVQAV